MVFKLPFIDEGGTNVPDVPVLSSDILGDTFVSVYEGVSLLVVTAVEDLTLEFSAVSSKLGRCLTWLSACCITASSAGLDRDLDLLGIVQMDDFFVLKKSVGLTWFSDEIDNTRNLV